MRQFLPSTIASLLFALALPVTASSQEILFPEEELGDRWVASAGIGMVSPVGSDEFSTEWNGQYAFSGTLEYFPSPVASFGVYGAHARFAHSGHSLTRDNADCMLGTTRVQSGGGIVARVYAARWSGVSLTLGTSVGALRVVRERPMLDMYGDAYGKVDLKPTFDLDMSATFGLEATVAPGMSMSLEGGYEGVENQISLAHSLVMRTSLRVGL